MNRNPTNEIGKAHLRSKTANLIIFIRNLWPCKEIHSIPVVLAKKYRQEDTFHQYTPNIIMDTHGTDEFFGKRRLSGCCIKGYENVFGGVDKSVTMFIIR